MSIWKKNETIEDVNQLRENTLSGELGILITEIGEDYIKASMPVNAKTRQPMGILHGGASVVLAESTGSFGSFMAIPPGFRCVGLEVNANHLRSVKDGHVHALARPVHLGGLTHIWDIRITDDSGRLVCISRLTMAIIKGEAQFMARSGQ